MKTIKLMAIALVLIAGTSQAQESEFGIRIGFSNPTGDFADDNVNKDDAGFADNGFNFGLNYVKWLNESGGFTAAYRYTVNGVNDEPLAKDIEDNVPPGTSYTLETEGWTTNSLLVGYSLKAPLGENADLQSRVLVGFSSITSAKLDLTLENNGVEVTSVQDAANATGFAFAIGGGVSLHVSDNTNMYFGVEYFQTAGDFDAEVTDTDPNGTTKTTNNFEQSVSMLALDLGIAFKF